MQKRGQKDSKSQRLGKTRRHRTAVLMNSQQLWFYIQDKVSQQFNMEGGTYKLPSLAEESLIADGFGEEGELVFFKGLTLGRSTMLQ